MAEMRIPFFKPSIDDSDIEAVAESLRSGWLTSGPNVKELERELAEYCGATYVNAVNSATAALHLALCAWDIGPGDEVIAPVYTFSATANVVIHTGATPVLVDVRDSDANIDPEAIERAITPRTKVIIPVDFAGEPCQMDAILDKYGSIGASPYAVDVVSLALETRHGVWMAEVPIKPKGISKKKRTIGSPEFRHFTEIAGRFVNLLPVKDGATILH